MVKERILLLINDKNKKNFFIYGLGQVFNLISPLIIAPLVIAKCQDSGYGKVGLGFAMALFLILIVDYAFDIKGIKSVSENRHESNVLEQLFFTTLFTKALLFVLVFITSLFLLFHIPFMQRENDLFLLSLTIVFAQVFNPIWFLQGVENFKWISIINIASKTTYVTLVIVWVKASQDYILVNFFLGISSFIFNVIGLFYVIKSYKFKFFVPQFSQITHILKTDFSFCISQLFLSARQLSPLIFASYFLGLSVAGQYRVIEQIINLFRTFCQVFLKFYYAQACYKFLSDLKEGWFFWRRYVLINVSIVCISLLFIVVFSEEILMFFNLSKEAISKINIVFQIGLIISLLMSVTLSLEQLMFIRSKNKVYVKITIFVTILTIVLLLLLINKMQLLGIIITLIIAELFSIIFYFINAYLPTQISIKNENTLH